MAQAKFSSPASSSKLKASRSSPTEKVRSSSNLEIEDIMKAYDLLLTITVDQVRIHKFAFTAKMMYSGIAGLDASGPKLNSNVPRGVSEHEILRKNIYYLARQATDLVSVAIQMAQRGYFTLDEKDVVMDQRNDLLRGLEFFSLVIKLDPDMFDKVVEMLRMFNNSHIAKLLTSSSKRGLASFSTPIDNKPPHPGRAFTAPVSKAIKPSAPWVCLFCTFENPVGAGNICQICFKTQGSPYSPVKAGTGIITSETFSPGSVRSCVVCTLDNPIGTPVCSACGSGFTSFEEKPKIFPPYKILAAAGYATAEDDSDSSD